MAVALPPTPRSIGFPHNILHDSSDFQPSRSMEQSHVQKPSLPSISSLIEAVKDQPQNGLDRSPSSDHPRKLSGASSGHPTSPARSTAMGSPRSHPPPTPPLPGPSSFDFHPRHSSGNTSPASTHASHQGYYNHNHATIAGSTNPEHYAQQPRSSYPPIPEPGQWAPTPSSARSPTESSQTDSMRKLSYPEPPSSATSITSSIHLENGNSHQYASHSTTLAQQRPLPSSFPPIPGQAPLPPIDPQMAPPMPSQQSLSPSIAAVAVPSPASAQAANAWQHHHYFPPTNSSPYPPPADRYVCPTCQKPFSRPSSLKIHTYSHTGEKPFKCKHDGCGKFFSVRSNMKRHEKGCHGGDSGSNGGSSPKA